MNLNKQWKNTFSFNIKILDKNKSNPKKLKDIFIRKQDIYLIKLLEKRSKRIKITEFNKSLKKIPFTNKEKNETIDDYPKESKLIDFKNIRIIKKKLDNSEENNHYILENIIDDDTNIDKNQFEDLITSKIYNSDTSRNNKTMLNALNENLQFDNNDNNILKTIYKNNNKKINLLNSKYTKTALSLINQTNSIEIPYETNIKFRKKENKLDNHFNSKLYNDLKNSLLEKNHLISEKAIKFKKNSHPLYLNIFNKVNLTENQNDLNNSKYNNQKSFKSNNKIIQFHQVFNLFKKEYKINEIKNKIKYNHSKFERNNFLRINHSLNKEENIKTLDNIINGLPLINRGQSKN